MTDLIKNTRESIYNRLELLFKLVEKLQLENTDLLFLSLASKGCQPCWR